jgi:hypothetical protein
MRFIVDRWYVVPIAAMVAIYICSMLALGNSHQRVLKRAESQVDRLYKLAQGGSYRQIVAEGLASERVAEYLQQQDRLFGPINEWNQEITAWPFATRCDGRVSVVRARAKNWDNISSMPGSGLEVGLDAATITDDEPRHGPIRNPEQALAAARHTVHQMDADLIIMSLRARQVGDQWLVIEDIFGQQEPNYLVLSDKGIPLQHVKAGEVTPRSPSYD